MSVSPAPLPDLLEREADLAYLIARLSAAAGGAGGVVVVEGPAGQGKTALLRTLRGLAGDQAGAAVLHAVGAAFERDFAFGVARQLLEAELLTAGAERRARLLAGAAARAAAVLEGGEDEALAADATHARLHALYWLVANLAEERPLLLVVDDAHWADAPSLRFLEVLARRVEDVPVLVVVGARPSEPGAEQELLDALAAAPAAGVLRLAPLSRDGVRDVLATALGGALDDAFVDACVETSRGSPLLVQALAQVLADAGVRGRAEDAPLALRAVPGSIGRAVAMRLRRLPPEARAVARSVAVLGDRSRLGLAAELAGLPEEDAVRGNAALVDAQLLERDALRFTHPMVRQAVHDDLVAGERAAWHRRAARLIADHGAPDDEVALHLALTEPAGDEWAARVLAAAGRKALSDGAPDIAARHLARALAEPPAPGERAAVLLAVGTAEARAGLPDGLRHLEEAQTAGDPHVAAQAAQMRASELIVRGRSTEAAACVAVAIDPLREVDPAAAARLEDHYLETLPYADPEEYRRRVESAGADASPAMLSHRAWAAVCAGEPSGAVAGFARRAFSGDLGQALATDRFGAFYGLMALLLADAVEDARAALDVLGAHARRAGSLSGMVGVGWMETLFHQRFGDLRVAEHHARRGFELLEGTAGAGIRQMTRLTLAGVLLDQGRLEEGEAVMHEVPLREDPNLASVGIHGTRGRLAFEQGRYEAALDEIERQVELDARSGKTISDRNGYRELRIVALHRTGRTAEAAAAAERELAVASGRDLPGAVAEVLLARALTLAGDDARADLEAAVASARRSPRPRVLAQALGELGAHLRRTGQRSAAREPLREARDLAHRCGAHGLEARLHEELVVAGARPQRVPLAGLDSLTAAERRVADLAVQGMRNREIAETLFVTLKTVEVHLGRVYAKLDIKGRSQLADALGG